MAPRVPEGEAEAMAVREVRVDLLPGSEVAEKVDRDGRAVEAVRRPARMRAVVSRGVKKDLGTVEDVELLVRRERYLSIEGMS